MNADSIELIRGAQSILFVTGYQYGWYLSEVQDWLGTSDDKVGTRERPQAHGAFDVVRSLRTAKTPSFRVGHNSMGDAVAVEAAIDELSAIGADGPVTMRVTTPAGVSEREVTIQVSHLDVQGLATGSVAVDCVARDPRRYSVNADSQSTGPAQAGLGRTWPAVWPLVWPGGGSSGRITLTNTGKAPSAPTFILSGGFDTALITCLETGARIGLNRLVPVGSDVVIDTKTRRATIDGQSDVSRWLQFREWELIPGGESRTYQFDATGVVTIPGPSVEERRNLIPASDTSIATGWTPTAGAVTSEGGRLKYTATSTGPARLGGTVLTADVKSAGAYVASFKAQTSAASITGVRVYLYDSATTVLRAQQSFPLIAGGAENKYEFALTATGVFNTVYMEFYGAPAAGSVGYVTEPILEVGSTQRPWFNGNFSPDPLLTPSWLGAAGASESVLSSSPPPTVTALLEGQVRSAWW